MHRINKETVIACSLGFVVVWFGVNEIMHPASWAIFAPAFLSNLANLNYLVMAHGILLIIAGLAVAFDFHRRVAAFVLFLLIGDIIFTLLSSSGLDEIAVRDIGLLGIALALSLRN